MNKKYLIIKFRAHFGEAPEEKDDLIIFTKNDIVFKVDYKLPQGNVYDVNIYYNNGRSYVGAVRVADEDAVIYTIKDELKLHDFVNA